MVGTEWGSTNAHAIECGPQGLITGAQSLMLMHHLRASSEAHKLLSVKLLPPSAALEDRQRVLPSSASRALWARACGGGA